ncbi:MAG: hypothetical protein MHM6MM_000255 [Cercozoa sp. M6MM]
MRSRRRCEMKALLRSVLLLSLLVVALRLVYPRAKTENPQTAGGETLQQLPFVDFDETKLSEQMPRDESLSLYASIDSSDISWDGIMPLVSYVDRYVVRSVLKSTRTTPWALPQLGLLPPDRIHDMPSTWQIGSRLPLATIQEGTGPLDRRLLRAFLTHALVIRTFVQLTTPKLRALFKGEFLHAETPCVIRSGGQTGSVAHAMHWAAFTPRASDYRLSRGAHWHDAQIVCVFQRDESLRRALTDSRPTTPPPTLQLRTSEDGVASVPLQHVHFLFDSSPLVTLPFPRDPVRPTVASVVGKIYAMPSNLAYWVRHQFDVLAVDYIVFYVVTTRLSLDSFERLMREQLVQLTSSPEVVDKWLKRIFLMSWHVNSNKNTHYTFGDETSVWDMIHRFRGVFDVVQCIDPDEFVWAPGSFDAHSVATVHQALQGLLPRKQHAVQIARFAVVCDDASYADCTRFFSQERNVKPLFRPENRERVLREFTRCRHAFGKSYFRPTLEMHPYVHFSMQDLNMHKLQLHYSKDGAESHRRAFQGRPDSSSPSDAAVILHVRQSVPDKSDLDFDPSCTSTRWRTVIKQLKQTKHALAPERKQRSN